MSAYSFILEKFKKKTFNNKDFQFIAKSLDCVTKSDKNNLRLVLESLEKDKKIIFDGKVYKLFREGIDQIKGVVRCNARGFAFLSVEGKTKDYFIPPQRLGDAFDGDTVIARRIFSGKSDDEVEVVKIVERGVKTLTGTFDEQGGVGYVRPDKASFLCDVIIPSRNKNGAKKGDKVFIDIIEYPFAKNPIGKITKILGKSYDLKSEAEALVLDSGVVEAFSDEVVFEASNIQNEVTSAEINGRLDLRKNLIFTIDGETARDFDDAVSLEINEVGNYVLGVHIADVSNYVTEDSHLDDSAYSRGTSIYLPDRVIPMLPFELSNGICSLNEKVDRLTLSVIAELDANGQTLKVDFFKSVINSKHRMTYTDVQKIIDGDERTMEVYADIVPTINRMNELKYILEANRREEGAIDLSVKESDVFEKDGEIFVSEHQVNDATRLIEQFMIFANVSVANHLAKEKMPTIYRVHDKPSLEKVEIFKTFLNELGISNTPDGKTPKEYQQLLDFLVDKPVFSVVNQMLLRSMQKAVYSERNIGHFGLAADCYLHFTSPIRRYPDLVVHRILKAWIDGKKEQIIDLYGDFVKKSALNSSLLERRAEVLERNVDDLYKVFYMKNFIGYEFDGIVSGVTNFGVFVELENSVEGMIRLEDLPRGHYKYDAERMRLSSGKLSFQLGEQVHIGVLGSNIAARRVEFIFLNKITKN